MFCFSILTTFYCIGLQGVPWASQPVFDPNTTQEEIKENRNQGDLGCHFVKSKFICKKVTLSVLILIYSQQAVPTLKGSKYSLKILCVCLYMHLYLESYFNL